MILYTPIFKCAELKLAFKGKLTWKVADTLHFVPVPAGRGGVSKLIKF